MQAREFPRGAGIIARWIANLSPELRCCGIVCYVIGLPKITLQRFANVCARPAPYYKFIIPAPSGPPAIEASKNFTQVWPVSFSKPKMHRKADLDFGCSGQGNRVRQMDRGAQ
jgi:hypothetical protein